VKRGESAFPELNQTELPTCPVCLERMDDSVTGQLTIVCNHTFHCLCLSKWRGGDTTCPVCRYCQDSGETKSICVVCSATDSLWICLICGHIGCGRYKGGHANDHYLETQHTYALELETQRVWDYMGDNYVHRLIQNKADGKLVELSGPMIDEELKEEIIESKRTAVALEYTYLLTTQLETQREYFEQEMTVISKQKAEEIEQIQKKLHESNRERDTLVKEIEKQKKAGHKKLSNMQKRLGQEEKELDFLRQCNELMQQNQTILKEQLAKAEEENQAWGSRARRTNSRAAGASA